MINALHLASLHCGKWHFGMDGDFVYIYDCTVSKSIICQDRNCTSQSLECLEVVIKEVKHVLLKSMGRRFKVKYVKCSGLLLF